MHGIGDRDKVVDAWGMSIKRHRILSSVSGSVAVAGAERYCELSGNREPRCV